MPIGLGARRARGQRYGVGRGMAAPRGGGSQSAAAANAGAAPGAGKANRNRKGGYKPLKTLRGIETDKVLTGRDLTRAANALAVLETRPQIRGYARLARQLGQEREREATGLGRLGSQLQEGVTDVYKNIAQSEAQVLANQQALGAQLTQTSADIAKQGAADLTTMQNTQTEGLASALASRGAPGGGTAQQELAAAVAAQKASQNANSQASQQFAAQQGSSYGSLAASLAGAAQLQGAAAVGGIGSSIINRIAKSNREYGGDIREARAKQAEAVASRGGIFNKNLLQLRGQEQEFRLGQAAVRSEREKQKLEEEKARQDQKQTNIENKQWAKEFGLAKWEAEHPNATSGERREKIREIRQDERNVRAVIPTAVAAAKGTKEANNFEAYVGYVNSKVDGVPESLVRKVLKVWWEKRADKRRAAQRQQQRQADKIIGTKIPGEQITE